MAMNKARKSAADKKRLAKGRKRTHGATLALGQSLIAPPNDIDLCLCPTAQSFSEVGIGSVVVLSSPGGSKRRLTCFMIDTKCLGVKDSFQRRVPLADVESVIRKLQLGQDLVRCEPSFARGFVEEAVAYGRSLGFEPGGAFDQAFNVFSSIAEDDVQATHFRFGSADGKPLYIAGPNDSESFQSHVMRTLEKSAGAGNYSFVLPCTEESVGW
jgi:hypothetical protein